MQSIVDALLNNKGKIDGRLDKEAATRDELAGTMNALVTTGRQYYKAVKDYEAEIGKNEILENKLARRAAKAAAAESAA